MNSVITPAGVILPIAGVATSRNHRFPSGPTVISAGAMFGSVAGGPNSLIAPDGVTIPIALLGAWPVAVNHMFPSGPR